ncbi:hypothetical protein NN561_012999 [Cricetulus griseus]
MSDFGCVGRELRNSSPCLLRGPLKEALGCRARLGLSRARRRAKDTRSSTSLPPRGPRRQSPSGGATSAERPPVSSASYSRARTTRGNPDRENTRARPQPAPARSEQSSDRQAA